MGVATLDGIPTHVITWNKRPIHACVDVDVDVHACCMYTCVTLVSFCARRISNIYIMPVWCRGANKGVCLLTGDGFYSGWPEAEAIVRA